VTPRRCFIERARPDDLAALVELERQCSSHPWSEATLASSLACATGEDVLVARAPLDLPTLAGFCVYRTVADEVQIHDIGVHPAHRRGGLARSLLDCALQVASRAGARGAHLEVRESNGAAIALYRRLGFQPAGWRVAYYTSPTEDALLLSIPLPRPQNDGA
jgi:ribosomal-protein-alanine N-acetyltransferase